MTQAAYSETGYASRPAYLFEFPYTDDEADTIRLTSADHDLTVEGYQYTMMSIDGARWKESGGDDGSNMNLVMPLDNNPLADLYLVEPPDNEVGFTLRAIELDDPDQQVLTYWIGRIVNVSREYPNLVVTVEGIESSLDESGNRGYVEPSCRHVHYSTGGGRCELIKAEWQSTDTITAMTSATVLTLPIAATFDDGWFVGGELAIGSTTRTIIEHTGDQLTLSRQIPLLDVDSVVDVCPGCDHTAETCLYKYGNLPNYGGEDFVPDETPWAGIALV